MKLKTLKPILILSLLTCLIIVTFSQVRQIRYQEAIESGNSYYQSGDYINAKVAFQLALRMKAGDDYAQEMITLSLDLIKGQSEKRKIYSDLLVQADLDFRNLKLQLARSAYQKALTLFPFEKYPKKQIERIDLIILENQEIIKDNEEAIIEGDRLFGLFEYEDAKIEFQYALGLIPGQEYPKQRLRDLRRIMTGNIAANMEVKKAMALSNTLLAQGDTLGAKAALENVLLLEPTNNQAQEQLNQINSRLSDSKKIEDLIKKAEAFFAVGDLYNAERTYRDALMLNPNNNILRARLEDIEQAIAKKRTTPLEDYENAIREGNRLMLEGKIEEAKKFFDYAARLRPNVQNPLTDSTQFAKQATTDQPITIPIDSNYIEDLMKKAEAFFAVGDLLSAEKTIKDALAIDPQNRILQARLKDIQQAIAEKRTTPFEDYENAMREGNRLMLEGKTEEAKQFFDYAARLKPSIKNLLADSSQFAQQATTDQPITVPIDSNYIEVLMKKAEAFFAVGDLLSAEKTIKDALAIDPQNRILQARLKDIQQAIVEKTSTLLEDYEHAIKEGNKLMLEGRIEEAQRFYDYASKIKPGLPNALNDSSRFEQLSLKDQILKSGNINYDSILNEALKQLESNNLATSLDLLNLADSLRQSNAITASSKLRDSIQNIINLRNQSITAFDQYLIEARNLINENRLAEARLALENAQRISANFELSTAQTNLLDEISKLLSQKEQIASLIKQAYEYQLKGDFISAQRLYQEALALDPNSVLIPQRLLEIQRLLVDEEARNKFLYNQALTEAERLLAIGDYNAAYLQLEIADSLHLRQHPKLAKYDRLEKLYQSQVQEARKKYENLIVNADYYYRAREFDKALQAYVDARALFPFEKYPQDMIARITNQFSSKSLQTLSEGSTEIKGRGTHKIEFEPIDISERKDIYFYIKLKNISKIKNLKVIFNYGKDGQKNGGVIVRLVESDEVTDYLVRVGNQYRWFSEDNNWISLQAEGGDVELLLCKITKAD